MTYSSCLIATCITVILTNSAFNVDGIDRTSSLRNRRSLKVRKSFRRLSTISADETKALIGPPTCANPYPDKIDIELGFFGNSIQYFNDCPRIIQQMMIEAGVAATQQTCVKGGASYMSLFDEGCSMKDWLPNKLIKGEGSSCKEQAGPRDVESTFKDNTFDYVVINDQSQYPTRDESRIETTWSITGQYAPSWPKQQDGKTPSIPILVQTPAYRYPVMIYTIDLGDFHSFTDLLAEGLKLYKDEFAKAGIKTARIAPVGEAFKYIYDNDQELFGKLYAKDNYHPSLYGTYLQALVIFMTILPDKTPPPNNPVWWDNSRALMDTRYPTTEEASTLYDVAMKVMKGTTSVTTSSSQGSADTSVTVSDKSETSSTSTDPNVSSSDSTTSPDNNESDTTTSSPSSSPTKKESKNKSDPSPSPSSPTTIKDTNKGDILSTISKNKSPTKSPTKQQQNIE